MEENVGSLIFLGECNLQIHLRRHKIFTRIGNAGHQGFKSCVNLNTLQNCILEKNMKTFSRASK